MPRQRLSMRRIKQLLTMRFGAGASARSIAQELGIAPSTAREYLNRAAAAGIVWPLAGAEASRSVIRLCSTSTHPSAMMSSSSARNAFGRVVGIT